MGRYIEGHGEASCNECGGEESESVDLHFDGLGG